MKLFQLEKIVSRKKLFMQVLSTLKLARTVIFQKTRVSTTIVGF